MRRALASGLRPSGLVAGPAPVAGSTRMTVPLRTTGSPAGRRRLWLRSAPPRAVGGDQDRADAAGRVAARVLERRTAAACRRTGPSRRDEAGALAARRVQRAVGSEAQVADRVARELLAPVLDQDGLGAGRDVARGRQPGQPAADDAAVGGRAGRGRAGVVPAPAARAADRAVLGVQDVDVRASPGSRGRGSCPAGRDPSSRGPWCAGPRRSSASCRPGCRRP